VPDLAPSGFHPIEGRLLSSEDGPAAQFAYENGSGERLARIFATGSAARRRSAITRRAASGPSDEDFGYTIAAKADRELLLCFAELVYRQTSPDSARAKLPLPPRKSS
jgi:anti-sigma factor RsiW